MMAVDLGECFVLVRRAMDQTRIEAVSRVRLFILVGTEAGLEWLTGWFGVGPKQTQAWQHRNHNHNLSRVLIGPSCRTC